MRTKLSAIIIVTAMLLVSVVVNVSDNAKAEFIVPVANNGAPNFTPLDVAWNDAGTMAVVVGDNSSGGYNAYSYWPLNDSWDPIPGYSPNQVLTGVTYWGEPQTNATPSEVTPPSLLLVNADVYDDGHVDYYNAILMTLNVTVDIWDVWDAPTVDQGKPTSGDMDPYDIVIWVPSRYMDGLSGGGDALTTTDEGEISDYLDSGGNFFLSNLAYSDYAGFGPGSFPYDYLGADYISEHYSDNEWYVNETVGDSVFDGVGSCQQYWSSYGWSGRDGETDEIVEAGGTICFWGYDDGGGFDYQPVGIRYEYVGFKSVFFGFPFETLNSADAESVMEKMLEWFVPGSQTGSGPSVLVVDADHYEWGLSDYYVWSLENNSAEVTVWDVWSGGVPNQGKPITSDMDPYDLVVWVPSYDMYGEGTYGMAFDSNDEWEVENYLDGGGNFFISSTCWAEYTSGGSGGAIGGPWGPTDFIYDYMAVDSASDDNQYDDAVQGSGPFSGFGPHYLDWSRGGWGGGPTASPLYVDWLAEAHVGADCMSIMYDMPPLMSHQGGMHEDGGTWKTMFMAWPFETLQPADADEFWNLALDWYGLSGATPSVDSVLVVDADAYGEGTSTYYGLALLNNSVSTVDLWDVYGNYGAAQGKPASADLSGYDAVFWVPDREMDTAMMQGSPGDPFDSVDEATVAAYLSGGGNFMLANTYYTQYTTYSGGAYDPEPGDFTYDYLGLDLIWDISSNYDFAVNETVGDAAYGGIGDCPLNWNGGGWSHAPPPVGVCDELGAGLGTICFFGDNGVPDYQPLGIRYDEGTFRTVFFGFPLETLSPTDRDDIMGMTIDWFAEGLAGAGSGPIELGAGGNSIKASTKTTLDQTSEWMGNMAYYDVGSNPPFEPWAQSFVPNANHISKAEFYMYHGGDPDDFRIEICPDWGSEPAPYNLTYGWIDPSTIANDPARGWAECWFENGGATLIPGRTYWIVCDRLSYTGPQNWAVDYDEMYGNGVVLENSGSWVGPQSYDWLFRTYANETTGVPSATIGPDRDNGIFEESNDESNGAGMVLRAGRNGGGDIRRSFIHFDVASSIPVGSTIDHVELKMYCNGTSGGPQDVSVRRVQVDWGEGVSDDGGIVEGAPATTGDTTWHWCKYATTTWLSDGGSYAGVSASRNVAAQDEFYTWGTTSWMVSDVQGWLDNPGGNYGWAIIGTEVMDGYFKEFSSRESNNNTRRPELKIFYTLPATGPYTVSIQPEKDNTIYDNLPVPTEWSNGWGDNLFAGEDVAGNYKRALMKFDIEGSIPDGATITGVNLTMYCDKYDKVAGQTLRINSLNVEWGEAGSHAPGNEESPDSAQMGDATWNYPLYGGASWTPGGDFIATPSGSLIVGNSNRYYTWSSATMIADVQDWLDNAGTNHGWILIGYEGAVSTTKRFVSRSNRAVSQRPMLNITYTMGSVPVDESLTYGYFWICGDYPGGAPSSVYNIDLSQGIYLNSTPSASWGPLMSIACDNSGNPLTVGAGLANMHYYNVSTDNWYQVGSGLNGYNFNGVDFNLNDNRFYAVGEWEIIPGTWAGTCFYTDTVPLAGGANCYRDLSTFSDSKHTYNSIAWNHEMNYGMVAAEGGVYLVDPWTGGPQTLNWTSKVNNSINNYLDVSWDTDGYNEAALVGHNGSGHAYYWRYYHTNPQVMYGYHDTGISQFICCDFKPPSSPKWLFIPYVGGGWRANILEDDQSSSITVQANYPHIFNIGFWLQSDIFRTPLLNTPVDPDTTYTFFIEGNWTVSGIDRWNDVAVNITAWYDDGWVGINSNPDDPFWSSEDHRTRQFNMTYLESSGVDVMTYPFGAPGEFEVHSTYSDPGFYGPDGSWHRLYINVTFKEQTIAATGEFFNGPPTMGRTWEKNAGLNDQFTWDFYVDLYDGTAGPATDIRNRSYDEFGIKEAVSILTSGSPNGGAPPGSNNVVLSDPSQLTYSSNTNYFVNVSIPNLYKDGDIFSPYWIPATDVEVINTHSDVTGFNSDLVVWTPFLGPDLERCVWGQTPTITPMNPVYNGTVSAGPWNSDYNTPGLYTEVMWRVSVPASLPEGVYFATITLSIEDN